MAKTTRQQISELAVALDVTRFLSYCDFLRELYLKAKDKIDNYTYLRFADDLGFSATNVIRLVIVGERPLTSKAAERIAMHLDFHGSSRRYWTSLVKYINARVPVERERFFRLMMTYKTKVNPQQLNENQLRYFSEWYNPVIREMAAFPGFDGTPEWIQERLVFTLRREQIVGALELLKEIGELNQDEQTHLYQLANANVITDSEPDDLAIVSYHQKNIEIAKESITQVDENQRDIRSLTVRLPQDLMPVLKAKIEGLLQEILAFESKDAQEDARVFQLNVQLFPFTKGKRR